MNEPTDGTPQEYTPVTEAIFGETSFLLNLLRMSTDHDSPQLVARRAGAQARWEQLLRTREANKSDQICCYWSPMVLNEIIFAITKTVLEHSSFEADCQSYLEQHYNKRLTQEEPRYEPKERFAEAKQERIKNKGRVPPWFIAEIFPFVDMKLADFDEHLRMTNDCWDSQVGMTLKDLMRWGKLDPADCVIALAAANSPANLILSHDRHFAAARELLEEHLGMRVFHD
jgi:hypothetical protein